MGFPDQQKSWPVPLILGDLPMKNVVKIFGILMSSLGSVHLISGIAHSGF